MGKTYKDDVKKETKEPKAKKESFVQLFHKNNSIILIEESKVKAHLAAGWRLEK